MPSKSLKGAKHSEIKKIEHQLKDIRFLIQNKRQQLGISQEHLAELTDISTSTIAYIEQGRRVPSLTMLLRLCLAMNLDLDISEKI